VDIFFSTEIAEAMRDLVYRANVGGPVMLQALRVLLTHTDDGKHSLHIRISPVTLQMPNLFNFFDSETIRDIILESDITRMPAKILGEEFDKFNAEGMNKIIDIFKAARMDS
jgi:hypothetical protein